MRTTIRSIFPAVMICIYFEIMISNNSKLKDSLFNIIFEKEERFIKISEFGFAVVIFIKIDDDWFRLIRSNVT